MKPPYAPPSGWAKYQQQRRALHKEMGLCRYCTERSLPGRTRCQYHYDYHQARWRAWYAAHRKSRPTKEAAP